MKLDVSPVGSGSITRNGVRLESYPANRTFYGRTNVTLEAVPEPGYYFTNWSGDLTGTENPVSLEIRDNSRITANYAPLAHTITLEVNGRGETEPAAGTHEYHEGDEVTVTAIPDAGWQFIEWQGDVTDPHLPITTLVVTSDKTLTADFSPIARTLSLGVNGRGETEPAVGTHEYHEGDVVSITAISDEGWQFDEWQGDVADPHLPTTTLIVTSDKTVTADFSPIARTLSLEINGRGETEPAAGTHEYHGGDVISITAIPDEGWQFDGWQGDVADHRAAVTSLIVTSNKTVTADFSRIGHTLSLEINGRGETEPAAGTHEYHEGDVISITAIPDEGWQFDGWKGDVTDPHAATTSLIVTSDKTVTADFSQVETDGWQVLRTIFDEVRVMFKSLGSLFRNS